MKISSSTHSTNSVNDIQAPALQAIMPNSAPLEPIVSNNPERDTSKFDAASMLDNYRKLLCLKPRVVERKLAPLPLDVKPNLHTESIYHAAIGYLEEGQEDQARGLMLDICQSHHAFHQAVAEALAQGDLRRAADYHEELAKGCAGIFPKNEDLPGIFGLEQQADELMAYANHPETLSAEDLETMIAERELLASIYGAVAEVL
jgi:hypothetical protein